MNNKFNKDTSIIVNGVASQNKKGRNTKKIIYVSGVVLLLIASALLVWFFVYNKDSKNTQTIQNNDPAYIEVKRQADAMFAEQDAARKVAAEGVLSTTTSPTAKASAYIELANVADISGNTREALSNAQKALEENESLDTFVAVAFYAQKMKDYDLAREMYGKAADAAKQAGGDNAQVEYDNYISMQKAVPIK